jgi:hypothetical protein
MGSQIGHHSKYNLAKKLFIETVLPFLSDSTDSYGLRLLRNGCEGNSIVQECNSKTELSNLIIDIKNFDNTTPLYATIKDAIRQIKNRAHLFDEIQLFVLTDGEDNCGSLIYDVFEKNLLKKLNINLDMLLVQFGVDSNIQSNNLTAFSSYIGAKSVQVKSEDLKNFEIAKKLFNKEISKSKLNSSSQLPHCFEAENKQTSLTWDHIEKLGYPRFWASILFEEKFIDWNPILRESIYEYEFKEFSFLASIRFKSNMSREILNNLLAQLIKPYYYCLEEIYWDFKTSCWKYFEPITQSEIIDNPERFNENKDFDNYRNNKDNYITNNPVVNEGACYQVVKEYQNIGFNYALRQTDWQKDKIKTIHEGDFLIFKERSKAGRPKKQN